MQLPNSNEYKMLSAFIMACHCVPPTFVKMQIVFAVAVISVFGVVSSQIAKKLPSVVPAEEETTTTTTTTQAPFGGHHWGGHHLGGHHHGGHHWGGHFGGGGHLDHHGGHHDHHGGHHNHHAGAGEHHGGHIKAGAQIEGGMHHGHRGG